MSLVLEFFAGTTDETGPDPSRDATVDGRAAFELAQTFLGDLPPYLADDSAVQAVVDAQAREFLRIHEAAEELRNGATPILAGSAMGMLTMWELHLGLAPNPPNKSLSDRHALVSAAWRRRKSGKGTDWRAGMEEALGTTDWTFSANDPQPGVLTIHMPFSTSFYDPEGGGINAAALLAARVREHVPAAWEVTFTFGGHFIVGISDVGDNL